MSDFDSDAWFSGFADGEGSFVITASGGCSSPELGGLRIALTNGRRYDAEIDREPTEAPQLLLVRSEAG